jgi:2-oxoglutarate ferredoxin oxidoreductase subunit gamma
MQHEITMAGFGGQGIMTAGQLLAYAGMKEGKFVLWFPSYGPEMRGGTAYCTVVVADKPIASPIIQTPSSIAVFNRPSMDKFESRVRKGGFLLVNSSLIDVKATRKDIEELYVPANEIALKAGNGKATNMVMLGAFIGRTGLVKLETVKSVVAEKMASKKALIEINYKALDEGFSLGKKK